MDYRDSKICSLCSLALQALQCYNDGWSSHVSKHHELSSATCPICAIIQFFCSLSSAEGQRLSKVMEVEFEVSSIFKDQPRQPDKSWERFLILKASYGKDSRQILTLYLYREYSPDIHDLSRVHLYKDNTLSEEAIMYLKTSLTRCVDEHSECHQAYTTYPTRLIRIDNIQCLEGDSDSHIFLEEMSESTSGPYFTLSHCWGGQLPIQLIASSAPQFRHGVSVKTLPKTFREAIYVCQRLQIRYLWIDSMCIFQDNIKDWGAEAAEMHQIYANAQCNLAATGSCNSSGGLSFRRNPLIHQSFPINLGSPPEMEQYWVSHSDWTHQTITLGPLNHRAWVMQERFLSNRIIHFARSGVYWECLHGHDTATSLVFDHRKHEHHEIDSHYKSALRNYSDSSSQSHDQKTIKQQYALWHSKILSYSKCAITHETDKLVAFNGIARYISDMFGIKIVCGMWKDQMIKEMLWEVWEPIPHRYSSWIAPSWSWASGDFQLSTIDWSDEHGLCDQERETAEIVDLDIDAQPSGRLEKASLILRGKVLTANMHSNSPDDPVLRNFVTLQTATKSTLALMNSVSSGLHLDVWPTVPDTEPLFFVQLTGCYCRPEYLEEESMPQEFIAAIALRRLETTPVTYYRMGILRLEGEECNFFKTNMTQIVEDFTIV